MVTLEGWLTSRGGHLEWFHCTSIVLLSTKERTNGCISQSFYQVVGGMFQSFVATVTEEAYPINLLA